MFSGDPGAYLPHKNPFLLVDRVLTREEGQSASGIKVVTHDEAGYPPMLLIESMAQMAGIVVVREKGEGGFLAAIDHAEFLVPVHAGDRVTITARIVKSFGRLYLCEGEAAVEGNCVARATLTLGVGKI